jgi:tRNA-2-methylthio-N6-dimethylallyladenosine synthase
LPKGEEYFKIKPSYKSNFSAFVPIGNGCNNFCSYCVVPYARGPEVYRSAVDIINEVKELIEKGYKEIILIAQNVNSYQANDYNFAQLLQEIAALPGEFWIQFSSSHPKDMTVELIKVIGSSNKICDHVHLAVQSGDNQILKAMNRHYHINHYYDLIKQIRQLKPGVSITTDVIVGFPGESRWQFHHTAKLFRKVKYDMAYIAQYSPRPGTAAAKLEDNVSAREKRRREKKLENILRKTALEHNQKQVGQEDLVLVEGKTKRQEWYGKDSGYRTVKFIDNRVQTTNLVGTFVKVKITKAYSFGIIGEIKEYDK